MILENWSEEAKQKVDNFSQKEKERLNAIIAMNIMVCKRSNYSRNCGKIMQPKKKGCI